MLDLNMVMTSKVHWANPNLHNPCTRFFVEDCVKGFPAGRTWNGVGDTYEHFHGWVNEQAHPWNIPPELTRQMWELRREREKQETLEKFTGRGSTGMCSIDGVVYF